eukprot:XP_001706960.1 Hypothetical protein GL50803_39340 [Giardia lamblia ATCC 50803]
MTFASNRLCDGVLHDLLILLVINRRGLVPIFRIAEKHQFANRLFVAGTA